MYIRVNHYFFLLLSAQLKKPPATEDQTFLFFSFSSCSTNWRNVHLNCITFLTQGYGFGMLISRRRHKFITIAFFLSANYVKLKYLMRIAY